MGTCFRDPDIGAYHVLNMLDAGLLSDWEGANWWQAFGRYSMGWWPSKIIVLLNLVQMIGYGLIDCVVGGQILSAVSPGGMSVAVGR